MFSEVGEDVGGVEELDCGHPGRDIHTVSIVAKHQRAPSRPSQLQVLASSEQGGDLNSPDEKLILPPSLPRSSPDPGSSYQN